jgi:hypothetical protein
MIPEKIIEEEFLLGIEKLTSMLQLLLHVNQIQHTRWVVYHGEYFLVQVE